MRDDKKVSKVDLDRHLGTGSDKEDISRGASSLPEQLVQYVPLFDLGPHPSVPRESVQLLGGINGQAIVVHKVQLCDDVGVCMHGMDRSMAGMTIRGFCITQGMVVREF